MEKRRTFLQKSLLASAAAMAAPGLSMANILQENYTTQKIRGNVSIFKGRGGTMAWMEDPDGIAVVDSQNIAYAGYFIDYIDSHADGDLTHLFNSHHHGDHSGGNKAFEGKIQMLVAHENSRKNQKESAQQRGNEDTQLYPDTVYSDSWSGMVGGNRVSCKYFGPAHTNGDGVTHFEGANVAHVGDLVFNRRHPYVDRGAGAVMENWVSVLRGITDHYGRDTLFICGHSGDGYDVLLKRSDLISMSEYLEKVLETVSADIRAGKSREQILAREEIPGTEWKGGGISRPLTAAYEELSGE